MKRCPECRRDYYDDSLLYCLDDGRPLLDGPASQLTDEPATAILHETASPGEAKTRAQIHTTDVTAALPSGVSDLPKTKGFDRRILLALVVLAVIVCGGFFGYRYFSSDTKQIKSIAVMPFINTSGDPDLEYISDGMTESLINSLSQLSGLSVKARSYVFRYKGKDVDPHTVGSELNVQAVLNGRIVRRGDSISISLDLVDASTGDQAWGEQYTRGVNDLAPLQNDIARDVSKKLVARLTGVEQTKLNKNVSQNSEAYQLYLQGRYEWNKRTDPTTAKAITFFQKAIEKDPNYAPAYVGLAEAYVIADMPFRERKGKAGVAARKAIELDPSLGEPHATLANVKAADLDYAGAEQEYKRAIELNPNYPTTYHWYAEFLVFQGRFDEGLATYRKALELDPYSMAIATDYGIALFDTRRYDEAIAYLKKLGDQDPSYLRTHYYLAIVYEKSGRYEDAVNERIKAAIINGVPPEDIAKIEPRIQAAIRSDGAKGYWTISLSLFMEGHHRRGIDPEDDFTDLAEMYGRVGQKDKAFELLNRVFDTKGDFPPEIKVSPRWDDVRGDSRFDEFLRKVKLL